MASINFNLLKRNLHILVYGISLALLIYLLQWLEIRFIVFNYAMEIYMGAIAFIFTGLGIWLALKLTSPKVQTVVIEKSIYMNNEDHFVFNETEFERLGLSKRELEVLQLISQGLSNQEIASQLFVSLNTIKTHCSNLFEKLEVKRRTQAIEKAKRHSLIP